MNHTRWRRERRYPIRTKSGAEEGGEMRPTRLECERQERPVGDLEVAAHPSGSFPADRLVRPASGRRRSRWPEGGVQSPAAGEEELKFAARRRGKGRGRSRRRRTVWIRRSRTDGGRGGPVTGEEERQQPFFLGKIDSFSN
ncbi:hypothetical protein KSP39_PZI014800 [Platanthera zijinensis]|uniref:Uncharacterized protein n=1 Tax=Platanthera zijinensis TaxID=2320716 RepID=A0AAP0G281_9ASPA